ncbi:MAG: DUF2147 domain-containing protein [Treponema sp.]|jgi:uncharacterized protein (DUF2147 family)|nr:DUF2147 domain-containing protein [Treponema sp.]
MKKAVFCFVVLFVAGFVYLGADPAEGFWLSVDDKTDQVTGGWEIYVENQRLCGRLVSAPLAPAGTLAVLCKDSYPNFPLSGKVNTMPVLGTPWLYGLKQDRAGQWSGGSVIDPNNGNIYKCKVTFHAADGNRYKTDTLEMRGEIGLGIGRSQFWRKASEAEARGQ